MTVCANCEKPLPRFGSWAVGHLGESIKVCGSDCGAAVLAAIKREEAEAWSTSSSAAATANSASA